MSEIQNLRQYSYRLYLNLIRLHRKNKSLLPSNLEQDMIKAFCVLAHAALEEYFETLTKETLKKAYKKFKDKTYITNFISTEQEIQDANKSIDQVIKTLILSTTYSIYYSNQSDVFKAHKSKIEEVNKLLSKGVDLSAQDIKNLTHSTNTYAKDLIKKSLIFFNDHIDNNHGASLKYILKLLIPVGIDIPSDIALNSLQNLSKSRGEYVHKAGSITQLRSASDVSIILIDIVRLCKKIEDSIAEI